MAKRNSMSDQLDVAIEAMMTHPDRPLGSVDSRLAALLRIAGDLRDLPSSAFKARLKAELLSAAQREAGAVPVPPHYGKVLVTVEDYIARIAEFAQQPPLMPYDLNTAFSGLSDRGVRFLTPLNECAIGVSRYSGEPHWERHLGGDELLHILEGEADVVTLTEEGPIRSHLRPGSIFVCPRGLWHRVMARSNLSMFFATPTATEAMDAAPPSPQPPRGRRSGARKGSRRSDLETRLVAHDLDAALTDLPELHITSNTTAEEADAATRLITSVGPCTVGVVRFSGLTPWERHPDGDELLHVLDGIIDVTVLTDDGPAEVTLDAGSVFVCPKGLWHRQRPHASATLLFSTPTHTTEVTFADDPRSRSL
jgi:quercetin dioxygenase-like cupin family protein